LEERDENDLRCARCTSCVAAADQEKVAAPVVKEVAKNYRQMRAVTTQPVDVDPGLLGLCRWLSPKEIEEAKKKNGPHAISQIKIYMDESGAEAFKRAAKAFPVGSVIVKEKQSENGVGGMIKRAPGYDLDHGDWEFFYFEDPAKIESGKIASCVNCHDSARQDHVFGDWAKKK